MNDYSNTRRILRSLWRAPRLLGIASVLSSVAILSPGMSHAQTAYDVPNGDFETSGNASSPSNWQDITGMFITSVNLGNCGDGVTKTGCQYNGSGEVQSDVIVLTNDPLELESAVVRVPFCVGSNATDDTYTISIDEIDAQGGVFDTHSLSGAVPSPQECDSLQIAPLEGTLASQTVSLQIRLAATSYTSWDNVGPISIIPDPDATPPQEEGEITPEQQAEIDQVAQDIADAAEDIYNFACGGEIPQIPLSGVGTAIGSFSPLHGILASNLTQELQALGDFQQSLQDFCIQETQAEAQATIANSVTIPEATAAINIPTGLADPMQASLSEGVDGALNNYVTGSDTLVTASNRANRLAVAQMQADARAWDRALGRPARSYETEDGPLLTEADILDDADKYEFAEGNYNQTVNRYRDLSKDIEPDIESRLDLAPLQSANTGEGACIAPDLETLPADASRNDIALANMQFNAANTLSASSFGKFVCGMVQRPARAVSRFCFFESGITLGGFQFVQSDGLCIYGGSAPSAFNAVFSFFPLGMMFLALLGGFKMFFH